MADHTIVLITGANTGIGYETVKALLKSSQKYRVFLGGRNIEKAKQAATEVGQEVQSQSLVEAVQIDVEDDDSISKAFETVSSKVDRVDVFINNAGAAFDGEIAAGKLTVRQAWSKSWDVNVTGANIVTETFLPLLLKSASPRLIFNTSGLSTLAGSSDPNNKAPPYIAPPAGLPKPPGAIAYRSSKAGLNMVMVEWTRILKNDGVKVWAVAPGLLATGLGGNKEHLKKLGAGDPSIGGEALCGVVEGKRDDYVGRVVRFYGDAVQPW